MTLSIVFMLFQTCIAIITIILTIGMHLLCSSTRPIGHSKTQSKSKGSAKPENTEIRTISNITTEDDTGHMKQKSEKPPASHKPSVSEPVTTNVNFQSCQRDVNQHNGGKGTPVSTVSTPLSSDSNCKDIHRNRNQEVIILKDKSETSKKSSTKPITDAQVAETKNPEFDIYVSHDPSKVSESEVVPRESALINAPDFVAVRSKKPQPSIEWADVELKSKPSGRISDEKYIPIQERVKREVGRKKSIKPDGYQVVKRPKPKTKTNQILPDESKEENRIIPQLIIDDLPKSVSPPILA